MAKHTISNQIKPFDPAPANLAAHASRQACQHHGAGTQPVEQQNAQRAGAQRAFFGGESGSECVPVGV